VRLLLLMVALTPSSLCHRSGGLWTRVCLALSKHPHAVAHTARHNYRRLTDCCCCHSLLLGLPGSEADDTMPTGVGVGFIDVGSGQPGTDRCVGLVGSKGLAGGPCAG
jgi:hypothetical protein